MPPVKVASGSTSVGWRALGATVLVMAGATSAHAWAGGRLPEASSLLVLGAVVHAGSVLALRGRIPRPLLLAAVAAAQTGLHTSFAGLAGTSHAGHEHAALTTDGGWTGPMVLAHVTVTVLTALVWRLCERAQYVVLRLLALWTTYVAGTPRTARGIRTSVPLLRRTHDVALPTRGPPLLAARA